MAGHFRGQRLPINAGMTVPGVFEQFNVERHRKCAGRRRLAGETEIIRMHVDQRHAPAFGHPIQFLEPDFRGALAQNQKKGGVLHQGVGQLDVAGARTARRKA